MSELIYEGKAKQIYTTEDPDVYLQKFKDDATAFNGLKKDKISHKGEINNAISSVIFEYLTANNIPTHFIKKISDDEMLVKKVDIIKVEVVCRNVAAGSLVKKFGFEEGRDLEKPIVEYYLKSDELGDPLFTDEHIYALGLANKSELDVIRKMALFINDLLIKFFKEKNIRLVDFKLEFGKDKNNNIILADEISPDTCRLWDMETNKKLDKDRFRFDLGEVEESYLEIKNRVAG
ncbi:MAG TPA: phosphoribosylaminoimidazolesuccinocarboxamide synthase [Ignavibacteria bacterium]|nr:phosphoribosylaminoimidazolesuccinocarboxamide synthase [Ignavibacteria bacterium]HMR39711.1 phosphoribosylaminoimidazolesuccinocarboxamide synthase [Ignavibacteria bacterium]